MTTGGVVLQPIRDAQRGTLAGVEARTTSVPSALRVLPLFPPDAWLAIGVSTGFLTRLELSALSGVRRQERRRVVLQIPARARVADHSFLNAATEVFRDQGVRLAVAEVRADYASLSRVLRCRPDMVTIDPSLVRDVASDRVKRTLVSAVVDIARTVGAVVTASGIGSADDLDAVVDLGATYAQGHLIGHAASDPLIWQRWSSGDRAVA